MKIAIQGIKGSFHHIVAKAYFGDDIELEECMSFTEIPTLLNSGEADSAVMAIENSIAGAILPNYALIDEFDLCIEGEIYTNIHHHLMHPMLPVLILFLLHRENTHILHPEMRNSQIWPVEF